MVFYKDINSQGQLIYNEDALLNYIDNILSTPVGTRPFNRSFGSFLEKYLFELPTDITLQKLELEIERAIYKWMKDIDIENINIKYTQRVLYIEIDLYSKLLDKKIIFNKVINLSQ